MEQRVKNAIMDSLKYIKRHSAETIDIKKLSKNLKFSYGYFERIFKRQIGVTPKTFQIELRLKDAVEMLKKTNLRVDEIIIHSGFRNRTQFFHLFSKQYGSSPVSFRKHKK